MGKELSRDGNDIQTTSSAFFRRWLSCALEKQLRRHMHPSGVLVLMEVSHGVSPAIANT
jgi:hypothetical protein